MIRSALLVGLVLGLVPPASADWAQTHKLTANDAASLDSFGTSVSISGRLVIVGAYFDDDGGGNSGSAYAFDAATGEQLYKLTAADAEAADGFGFAVAVSGISAVSGAFLDDAACVGDPECNSGSAYVISISHCWADIDDSGAVDFFDLVSLLSSWGPCAGCPEDLDGDGAVDFNDLLDLLFAWGACP